MRQLTNREIRFIQEAKKQAPNKDDVFGVARVGEAIAMTTVEAHDIVRILERDFGEVGYVKRVSGSRSDGFGEGNRAVLTDLGRELPLQRAEDTQAERNARFWRGAWIATTTLVAVVSWFGKPYYDNYVERKFLERQ